jgi:hypothetical protein
MQAVVEMAARRADRRVLRAAFALFVCGLVISRAAVAVGCPFCGVVGESLAQRRDRAALVAVAEADGKAEPDAAGLPVQPFTVRQMIRGETDGGGESRAVVARVPAAVEGMAIIFGDPAEAAGRRSWSAIAADEVVIGHVVTAPPVNEPAEQRLVWFAKRLEHPDPVIATDAFTEFGLAPYEAVRAAAGAFDAERLRRWVRDGTGDQRRRGFYGLALGLVAATRPAEREETVAVLREAISAPADDFRAGFDGLLAGLLVAEGEAGLAFLDARGLFGAEARAVDQRHALAALRFAWESLATSIPQPAVAAATRRLLATPVVAADAAIDLARYREWTAMHEVAALWHTTGRDDPLVRRAVAGYLTACPLPEARRQLEAIRAADPQRLEAAVQAAALPAGR